MNRKLNTIYRQWNILKMISRRNISVQEIRDRLGMEISTRTIQRDLRDLSTVFQLVCDDRRPGGWRLMDGAPIMDLQSMDPVAVLTFQLVEQQLVRMLPKGALTVLEPYFKAANHLAKDTDSKFGDWSSKVRVVSRTITHLPPEVGQDIVENVYTSLLEGRQFDAVYRTSWGEVKSYQDINPLGLVFVEDQLYLVVMHNNRCKIMLMHRFKELTLLDTKVIVPEGFNLDEYIAREFKFPIGGNIQLKVLFDWDEDINRLREAPVSTDQKIYKKDGDWILEATVVDSYQLRWWLRSYGERIEVKAPRALRLEFAEMARELASRYRLCRKPRRGRC